MTTAHQCGCGQPAPDATLCRNCTDRLAKDLGDVPAYAEELEVTLTRQRATALEAGGPSASTPLPFHPTASEAASQLRAVLTGWTRVLAEHGDDWPTDTLDAISRWLLHRTDWLARHEAGNEAATEIGSAMQAVRRVIDRPADLVYAGQCGAPLDGTQEATTATACDADLYAKPGHQTVTCKACGASYGVDDRRGYLLDALEDVLATATEIARGVSRLGQPVAASTIRSYRNRGRLETRGVNIRGNPTYRVGDVLDLLAAAEIRQQAS